MNDFAKETGINSNLHKPGNKPLKIYYGANSWGRTEGIGEIYPLETREKDFLNYYVEHFNAVELNATHYHIYKREKIKKWADKAEGRDFVFCPKVPQTISHYSSFSGQEQATNTFIDSIYAFGHHLGPVWLQLSDKFSPTRKENLYHYFNSIPANLQFFLEVRNPEWFEQGIYEKHLEFLKAKNIGSIMNDSPGRISHHSLSIPKCFIRYTPTGDLSHVKQWFNKIKEWGSKGLTEAYFFVQRPEKKEQWHLQLEALLYFKQLVS